MQSTRILLVCSVLALLTWLVGCSSKSTNSAEKMVGDTAATEYKAAEQIFSDANDMGNDGVGAAIDLASRVINSPSSVARGEFAFRSAANVQADTLEYHPVSKYWYFVHSQVDTEYVEMSQEIKAIVEWYVRDSLQFRHGDEAVAFPDSALLTELRFGRIAEGWNLIDADSLRIRQTASIGGEPGAVSGLGDVVINSNSSLHGSAQEHVENLETAYDCAFGFDLSGGWHEVALNMYNVIELQDCPSSGSISLSGQLAAACLSEADSVQFNGQWSASVTYANGTQTAVFENATTRWTHTEACGLTQPVAARIRK